MLSWCESDLKSQLAQCLVLEHLYVVHLHSDIVPLPRWAPLVPGVPEVLVNIGGVVPVWFAAIVCPGVREEAIGSTNGNVQDEVKLKEEHTERKAKFVI